MRHMGAMLKCLMLVGLLSACGTAAAASHSPPAPSGGNPQVNPAPLAGRWKIIPARIAYLPATEEGWRNVRIDVAFENESSSYSSPLIPTKDAVLFTDPIHFYPVQTLRTTGSIVITTDVIAFSAKVPKGFRVHGEYQNDAIMAFCFSAKIPQNTQPIFLRIPGYAGDISTLDPKLPDFPGGDSTVPVHPPDTQIYIPGKAHVTIGKFTRSDAWPLAHDLITATITIANESQLGDTIVNLQYFPIGEDGIIGAPFTSDQNCKLDFTRGPKIVRPSAICMIIPNNTKGVKIIFTGDMNEVFDSGL